MVRKTGKFEIVVDVIGSIILIGMLAVILLVGVFVMVNALLDLKYTNRRAVSAIETAAKELERSDGRYNANRQDPNLIVFLEQLKTRSRSFLDSNTISFLFQIFALALVSSAVYVLSRSQRNLRKAEETIKSIAKIGTRLGPFVANAPVSSTLGNYFLAASEESRYLRTLTDKQLWASCRAGTLEALTQLRVKLRRAFEERRGMESSQYEIFLDQLTTIRNHLAKLAGVEDLLKLLKECEDILREGEFVERYKKQLKEICGDLEND